MNEIKIIIKAVTEDAQKKLQDIKSELKGVSGEAKTTSSKFGMAMKGMAKTAAVAVAAIATVITALVALGKRTLEAQRQTAQLNAAFAAAGKSATEASKVYNDFYRFLGDADKATEASNLLIKLTQDEQNLNEWTKILQGTYATFPDSLPIEGLVESANETARVGKVTGNLADALNWAGASEDEFNAKLAKTTSYEEREALIRETLNGLYGKASDIYEKNNKALLEYNESQAKLDSSMAEAGRVILPLMTAVNNLGSAFFNILKPALEVIVPVLTTIVNWITSALTAIMSLVSAITGASTTISSAMGATAGTSSATNSANDLASGYDNAAKSAEKLKRATMGFDELNVVSDDSSASGDSGSGTSTPGYMSPTVNSQQFTTEVEQTESQASGLVATMKKAAAELKKLFEPTIKAWTKGFETIKKSWDKSKDNFKKGAKDINESLKSITKYVLGDFVPSITNSFSTNLAPLITDVLGFAIEEVSKLFQDFGYIIKDITEQVIIPAIDTIKNIFTDMFEAIGDAWAEHGEPFMANLSEALEHIRDTVITLYEEFLKPVINKITKMIQEVWEESLEPAYRKFVDAVMEIGNCLLQLYNDFIAPIVDWIVKYIVPIVKKVIDDIIDAVGSFFKVVGNIIGAIIDVIKGLVQFITGVFTGDWSKAWEGIKNIFKGIWDAIVSIMSNAWENTKRVWGKVGDFFSGVWNGIKNVFAPVGEWFGNIFSTAYSKITNAFSNAKTGFANVWSNIKSGFGNVSDWFKNTFSNAWQKVKDVFSKGGKIFDGIKDGILEGLKAVINGLIGGINKVIKVPFDGINKALKKLKDIEILGVEPFSWVETIKIPQIPQLAKGGIVDQATIAMIGERGKEAVVPLENNTEWIDKLVDKLTKKDEAPTKLVLMLDGKELGWANINSINEITRQTGALQLTLA